MWAEQGGRPTARRTSVVVDSAWWRALCSLVPLTCQQQTATCQLHAARCAGGEQAQGTCAGTHCCSVHDSTPAAHLADVVARLWVPRQVPHKRVVEVEGLHMWVQARGVGRSCSLRAPRAPSMHELGEWCVKDRATGPHLQRLQPGCHWRSRCSGYGTPSPSPAAWGPGPRAALRRADHSCARLRVAAA